MSSDSRFRESGSAAGGNVWRWGRESRKPPSPPPRPRPRRPGTRRPPPPRRARAQPRGAPSRPPPPWPPPRRRRGARRARRRPEACRRRIGAGPRRGFGFEVQVLEKAQSELSGGSHVATLLVVCHHLRREDDEQRFVLHAKHVLLGVRVDALHALEVLVVQALAKRAHRAPQLHGSAGDDILRGRFGLWLGALHQRDLWVLL